MPAFMNNDEQRKAHYQLQGTNQKCFHVYYLQITNYKLFLRILPAHKLGSDSSCFFVGRYIVLITRIRHESGLLHCFLYHMPRKLMPSFRKEATTTSLAALTIQGIFPPRYIAS